ncbi:MAG: hypothetical protein ABIN35_00885 [candidate division WOR-3 bacterium]
MEESTLALIILALLIGIVIYQSKSDHLTIQLLVSRFIKLIVKIVLFIKEVLSVCANKFREYNWNLIEQHEQPLETNGK